MENSTTKANKITTKANKITTSATFGEKKLKATIVKSDKQMASQMKITSPPSKPTRSRRTNRANSSTGSNHNNQEHQHPIYTHDNVKLNYVLQKVLTCSDVSSVGRIVLPKREAEENLPKLDAREGTLFIMKDVLSDTEWQLTYRFWANHKGRTYVLYKCGEFVRKNMLEVGDKLTLYQDAFKNVYFTITKKEKHAPPTANEHEREEEIPEEEKCEVNEVMTSHEDGSCSNNKREDIPVFIQFF